MEDDENIFRSYIYSTCRLYTNNRILFLFTIAWVTIPEGGAYITGFITTSSKGAFYTTVYGHNGENLLLHIDLTNERMLVYENFPTPTTLEFIGSAAWYLA